MTKPSAAIRTCSFSDLGWTAFFERQRSSDEADLVPRRISAVHRARLTGLSENGPVGLFIPPLTNTGLFAVGDWVLVEPGTEAMVRRLTRRTVMERHVEGATARQLAAANVDTLFIVTSCNADFDLDRLGRYLVFANQGGIDPVILLTKVDTTTNAETYQHRASELQRGLVVLSLDPRSTGSVELLAPWCGPGKTVALVGSSGVGKSTLVNTLAGLAQERRQQTGEIRAHDAKGRHTTTARSLHALEGGGWVIDTPGMRTLNVGDAAQGIEILFADIVDLARACKFADCTHLHEPGCAVRLAVAAGTLDPERLARWHTLSEENRRNTTMFSGPRGNRTPSLHTWRS